MDKPTSATPITEEEVRALTHVVGKRSFKWEFPEEAFNGEWWALEVPNNKVASAMNSYRNQFTKSAYDRWKTGDPEFHG